MSGRLGGLFATFDGSELLLRAGVDLHEVLPSRSLDSSESPFHWSAPDLGPPIMRTGPAP
jgi:hypothetical protein